MAVKIAKTADRVKVMDTTKSTDCPKCGKTTRIVKRVKDRERGVPGWLWSSQRPGALCVTKRRRTVNDRIDHLKDPHAIAWKDLKEKFEFTPVELEEIRKGAQELIEWQHTAEVYADPELYRQLSREYTAADDLGPVAAPDPGVI